MRCKIIAIVEKGMINVLFLLYIMMYNKRKIGKYKVPVLIGKGYDQ